MPIKSHIKEPKVKLPITNWKKVKYPCIGIAVKTNSDVVLFHANGKGILITEGIPSGNRLGTYSESWVMENFSATPSTQQFILSNV